MSLSADDRLKKVHEKLDAGRLPRSLTGRVYGGFGQGERCHACDEPILPTQVEYEVDFGAGTPTLRLHIACASVWEAELRRTGSFEPPQLGQGGSSACRA